MAAVNFWAAGLAAVFVAVGLVGAAVTVTVGAGVEGAQPAIAKAPSSAAADTVVRPMFIAAPFDPNELVPADINSGTRSLRKGCRGGTRTRMAALG